MTLTKGQEGNENLFPEGYKLNIEQSRCEDIDGNKIEDISFNTDTNSITVTSNKTSYCYLYFDKQLSVDDIRKDGSGLSEGLVGGMYRYIGTNDVVKNNYICLKEVGSSGCSTSGNDENMYRIIGITESGNIKVIKQIRYNKSGTTSFKWNSKSSVDSKQSDYYCGDDCPTWKQSEIYETLNGDNGFINTLNEKIRNKIEPQNWWYGDIGYDYMGSGITSEEVYKIESGQEATQYYNAGGSLVQKSSGIKWQKTSNTSSIGLMYVSDYLYAISATGHEKNCRSNYTNCKGSWIHETNNESSSTTYTEWTMSRLGRYNGSDAWLRAWIVGSDGQLYESALHGTFSVRPIFYLKSDVELGGAGSTSDPFYIKS